MTGTRGAWWGVPTAIAAGAVVRLAAAGLLLAAPQWFPMRDYPTEPSPAATAWERVLHRPRYAPIAEDETAYDALARSIVRGDGYRLERDWVIARAGEPTAYGGALYPIFVAAVYKLTGAAFPAVVGVQIALSVLAVAGLARIGAQLGGPLTGTLTAWGAALHPGLVMAPSLLMTEALSIPVLVALLLAAGRWIDRGRPADAAVLGALVGVGFLIRSPLGIMGIATAVASGFLRWRAHRAAGGLVRAAALAAVVGALLMTPWTVRNWSRYERFIPTDTKAGVNLWMYNRPAQAPGWPSMHDTDEGERDEAFRRLALDNIVEHPGAFARLVGWRAVRFWWPVPRHVGVAALWLGVAGYAAATLVALAGLICVLAGLPRHGREWLVAAALLTGWGLSALTAVGLRHRLTLEPLLMLCAAVAVHALVGRRAAPHGQEDVAA